MEQRRKLFSSFLRHPGFWTTLCLTLLVTLASQFGAFAATPPQIISYQGRLLDTNGVPVTSASATMIFRFYTAPSGGSCLWSNSSGMCASATGRTVTLTDGLFSENLGDTGDSYAAIADTVFADNAAVYLDVNVNGESLTPRKLMTASPYALNAATLQGLVNVSGGNVGVGTNTPSALFSVGSGFFSPFTVDASGNIGSNGNFSFEDSGVNHSIVTADNGFGQTSSLTIMTGDASAFGSGDVIIDVGTCSGCTGGLSLGTTNASTVDIGSTNSTTTIAGTLSYAGSYAKTATFTSRTQSGDRTTGLLSVRQWDDAFDFTGLTTDSLFSVRQDDQGSSGTAAYVLQQGTGIAFQVDDASADTTPFIIDSTGNVGIGTNSVPVNSKLNVVLGATDQVLINASSADHTDNAPLQIDFDSNGSVWTSGLPTGIQVTTTSTGMTGGTEFMPGIVSKIVPSVSDVGGTGISGSLAVLNSAVATGAGVVGYEVAATDVPGLATRYGGSANVVGFRASLDADPASNGVGNAYGVQAYVKNTGSHYSGNLYGGYFAIEDLLSSNTGAYGVMVSNDDASISADAGVKVNGDWDYGIMIGNADSTIGNGLYFQGVSTDITANPGEDIVIQPGSGGAGNLVWNLPNVGDLFVENNGNTFASFNTVSNGGGQLLLSSRLDIGSRVESLLSVTQANDAGSNNNGTGTAALASIISNDTGSVGDLMYLLNENAGGYSFRVDDVTGDTTPFAIDADGNVFLGGTSETLSNTGFTMSGDDMYVGGMLGVEAGVYTDGSFVAGASTTISNGSISQSSGESLMVQTTSADLTIKSNTSGDIVLSPAGTSGVGIGTATPITALEVPIRIPTTYSSSRATDTTPRALSIQGRYAYVTAVTGPTLKVYDISDPTSIPAAIGSVAVNADPYGVDVKGRYAYVTSNSANTLQVVDISNPASPSVVGSVATGASPWGVTVQGRYAYVGGFGSGKIELYDVSNPAAPVAAGSLSLDSGPLHVAVQGKYAYVANNLGNTVSAVDISNPGLPVLASSVAVTSPIGIKVQGRYVYTISNVSGGTNAFNVIDVSNPASMSVVGTASASGSYPQDIFVQGRYAIAAGGGTNSLDVFSIASPTAPSRIGSITSSNGPEEVYIQGRYLYATLQSAARLESYDLGGAYLQQVETGGLETASLSVRNSIQAADGAFLGGLSAGTSFELTGSYGQAFAGTTADAMVVVANSLTTGDAFDVTYTGTTGSGIRLTDTTGDSASNAFYVTNTDATLTAQTYLIRGVYADSDDANGDFLLFEDNNGTDQFVIGQDGDVIITGSADGTDALTLTAGDILISNGDLDGSGGDFNWTTDTADTASFTSASSASGDALSITLTSTADAAGIDALSITGTASNQTNRTVALINGSLTSSGTAAGDIANGLMLDLVSSAGGTETGISLTGSWDNGVTISAATTALNISSSSVTTDIRLQNAETIHNDTDGTITFTDSGSASNLLLLNATTTSINLSAQIGGTAQRLCQGGADGSAAVESIGDCGATQADLAEYYGVADDAGEGHIVVPSGEAVEGVFYGGSTTYANVSKSATAYQMAIGAVSTNPSGEILGEAAKPYLTNPKPIALVGRTPLKVNTEGGAIAVGDAIATSSAAGVGMKSTQPGPVVGYALSAWAGPGEGTIVAYIQPGWNAGASIGTDGSMPLFTNSFAFASQGTATALETGKDSQTLSFRGSGWNGSAAEDIGMGLKLAATDATAYRLSFTNKTDTEVAYVTGTGDLVLSGKLYPSDRGVAQTDKYIYYDGSAGPGGDFMRTNASGWATGSYDFAEMFPSAQGLTPGELVAASTAASENVERSSLPYQKTLLGIVSTKPGFLAGDNKTGQFPVALKGRVPTLVNAENGPVAIGDPLTSSSTPGYAMKATKAGPIVGYALEPFSGSQGSVVAFVSLGWWEPDAVVAPVTATTSGIANTASQAPIGSSAGSLSLDGNLFMAGGDILSVGRIAGIADRWSIEEDGTVKTEGEYRTLITSHLGEKVAVRAVNAMESFITLVGTSTLRNGTATVQFEDVDPAFNDVTSITAPVRVIVTPGGPAFLSVTQKDHNGFTVQDLNGVADGISFDWIVYAYRKDYEPKVAEPIPTVPVPPVADTTVSPPPADPVPVTESPADPVVVPATDVIMDPVPVPAPTDVAPTTP